MESFPQGVYAVQWKEKKKVNDRNVQQTLRRQMSISGKSIPFGATLPGVQITAPPLLTLFH